MLCNTRILAGILPFDQDLRGFPFVSGRGAMRRSDTGSPLKVEAFIP